MTDATEYASEGARYHAVFHFTGGGLYVRAESLGIRRELQRDGELMWIALPAADEVDEWGGELVQPRREAVRSSWHEDPYELQTAYIKTFEVGTEVRASGGEPLSDLVKEAFPRCAEVAEDVLAWARLAAGQEWLPSAHEGVELAWHGTLLDPDTGAEVSTEARWNPPIALVSLGDTQAADSSTVQTVLDHVAADDPLPTAETLLADAQAALLPPAVEVEWKRDRRDTARVVLLAAIAAEVKIKTTLTERAPSQFAPLLDVILENPREVTVAAGQLVDKPMQAALGRSLRDEDKTLFKGVTEKLFPLRNKVAHGAYTPTLEESQQAVGIAVSLFFWLDTVQGTNRAASRR